jgi:hypothetical protein
LCWIRSRPISRSIISSIRRIRYQKDKGSRLGIQHGLIPLHQPETQPLKSSTVRKLAGRLLYSDRPRHHAICAKSGSAANDPPATAASNRILAAAQQSKSVRTTSVWTTLAFAQKLWNIEKAVISAPSYPRVARLFCALSSPLFRCGFEAERH